MSDRLREALEVHDHLCELFDRYMLAESQQTVDGLRVAIFDKFVNGGEEAMHALAAAARRFLALTETGPDYARAFDAAHHIIWIEMELEFSDDETMSLARRVVDAALADYLTEEE